MTNRTQDIINPQQIEVSIQSSIGTTDTKATIGEIEIPISDADGQHKHTLQITAIGEERISNDLLSVSKLCSDDNYEMLFKEDYCLLLSKGSTMLKPDAEVILEAQIDESGLYTVNNELKPNYKHINSYKNYIRNKRKITFNQLHNIMGHTHPKKLKEMIK